MAEMYERKCPVCGEKFVTKHSAKRFCCAECVAEYNDIKKYLSGRIRELLRNTINDVKNTNKTETQLYQEFMKRW